MKEGWILVYSAENELGAKIAEDVLKQNQIVSHIVNEPDSAFPMLGRADLYAPADVAAEAIAVLKKGGIIEDDELV